jgi:phospholipase/carboxylesterase
MTEPRLQTYQDWTFCLRTPQAQPARLLILMHGWMGDENSMWVLARKISPRYLVIAPRGPFLVEEGGYSWREIRLGTWGMAALEDLRPAAEALITFVDDWSKSEGIDARRFDLMGFSQGAALTYTLTLLHPERIGRMAALSGFIPLNGETILKTHRFSGKPIFVSHGRLDELVPVEEARRAVALLKEAGADIIYCESETGHKLSKDCIKQMGKFFEQF